MIKEIENIMNGTVIATYAIHDLLSKVIELEVNDLFGDGQVDIRMAENECTFISAFNDYEIRVTRNLNTFAIEIRVGYHDRLVADASINVNGDFGERYIGKWDKDTKLKFVNWFTDISNIDVSKLITGREEAEEAEQVVPEVVGTSDMADCERLAYIIDRDTEALDDDSPVIYDDDDDED